MSVHGLYFKISSHPEGSTVSGNSFILSDKFRQRKPLPETEVIFSLRRQYFLPTEMLSPPKRDITSSQRSFYPTRTPQKADFKYYGILQEN